MFFDDTTPHNTPLQSIKLSLGGEMSDLGTLADELDALIASLGPLTGRQRILAATARGLAAVLFDPDERAKAAVSKELRSTVAELIEGGDDDGDDPAAELIARMSAKVVNRAN